MIRVRLKDGTERMLDEAQVTLTWTEGPTYSLAEVEKLVLVEPQMFVMPGVLGGMPVVGVAFRDASDLAIEVPMPLDFALDLAEKLPVDVISAQHMAKAVAEKKPAIARVMPTLPKPPGA